MKRHTRNELLRLLAASQVSMFELAANLSPLTPPEVVERHNRLTDEIGKVLDSKAPRNPA